MKTIAIIGLYFLIFYFAFSWITFQVRNPTCNESAFFVYFTDVVTFQKVDLFQGK